MEEKRALSNTPRTFISANGKDGFFSLYDEVFDIKKFDKIYMIFGGPGTGKSTFLRSISRKGTEKGARVEEIACSSDPYSLDGVILEKGDGRIGILDGTPPHARVITSPAVCEELIDLGAFWDEKCLTAHKRELFALAEQKKRAYACTYALLSALGALREERRLRLSPHFDREKARRQIKHKLASCKEKGEAKRRLLRSFSGAGEVVLPFPTVAFDNVLFVGGDKLSAEMYLSYFEEIARELSIKRTVFLSPLDGKSTDAVFLEESKTLLIKETLRQSGQTGRRIVADRFFTAIPEESKERREIYDGVKRAALTALAEAKEAHAAMEEYYIDGMNFDALAEFREKKTEEIVANLF